MKTQQDNSPGNAAGAAAAAAAAHATIFLDSALHIRRFTQLRALSSVPAADVQGTAP